MSLYRTWRPRTFADLVGQDAVVRTLTTALETGKLAHAYLFSGPRGSGKTSAAKILARCVNCVNGPTATPDNTCEACEAILNGNALDVLEIDAASNRGIDEIRALREAVKFAPSTMRYKVYIVDEAHMLTREGANAFLKTLEEPPPHAIFILATTAPEALPATILSRCQRYQFRRISIPVMIERMRSIAQSEKITVDEGALAAIAYRADGGLRDALTMLEQVAAFGSGAPIDAAVVDAAFGTTGHEHARSLLRAMLEGDAAASLRIVDEASDGGADMVGLARNLIAEYRHLLVARINPDLLERDLSEGDAAVARDLGEATPQVKIVRALRMLSEALGAARATGSPRLELETAVLRLVLATEDPTLEALAARVAALEGGRVAPAGAVSPAPRAPVQATPAPAAPAPAAKTQPKAEPPARKPLPPPAAPAGPLTPQKVRSLWQNVRTRVESEKISLSGILARTMIDFAEGTLTLRVTEAASADLLRPDLPTIERAVAEVVGVPLKVVVRLDGAARTPVPAVEENDDGDLLGYALKKLR
ncbi:MAG TPA: DNA polymerase III subunit gamma/tau [Candidatus Acidoferrales bacterium]|nr:DNA polymerase III subunit gamma/tau [Candidatus Acidoferrales bacterium]